MTSQIADRVGRDPYGNGSDLVRRRQRPPDREYRPVRHHPLPHPRRTTPGHRRPRQRTLVEPAPDRHHLGEGGVSLLMLMTKSRHKKPESERRYFHPSAEAIAEVTSLLAPGNLRH